MGNELGDTGKIEIDATLLNALIAAGVRDPDARELARMDAFGGCPVSLWITGLKASAIVFSGGAINLDWGTLPGPWESIGPILASANGKGPNATLIEAVAPYDELIKIALIDAIAAICTAQAEQKQSAPKANSKINARQVQAIVDDAPIMQPIDSKLIKQIQAILGKKGPKDQKRKRAGEQLIDWLLKNGKFISPPYGARYYLHDKSHKLFNLDTSHWQYWLYLLTGTNPASTDFKYFIADCQTASEEGKKIEVVRVAHWDNEYQLLRVSRFDGCVYRLDGQTIELEANGDGPALFEDNPSWLTYSPDFNFDGTIANWTFYDLPNWDRREEFGLLMRAWWLATFFTELCPTRPLLVLKGEKGSGKSMSLRVLLRMIFGPSVDVSGLPDKADGFMALTSNRHIVVLDNLDDLIRDIRNKIARLSTGSTDEYRKLYTNNEVGTVVYRCWLAITSRTPDTLQRDDLVDRTLILPVSRIVDNDRIRESYFLIDALQKRNAWWGDVLLALNQIVAEIRRNGIPDRSDLRLADWEALGSVIAATMGQEDVWENGIKEVKTRQAQLLLEDDPIVMAIESWLASQPSGTTSIATRDLYSQAGSALFGVDRPDSTWPRSVRSFGRRLAGIQRELQEHLNKSDIQMRWGILHGNITYHFTKASKWA